jgi:NAD(P) transhydrogenase subunit beta
MDAINPEFKNADFALVLGANDVVNPAAINDPTSPIAGMPILNVHEARTVMVVKRSLSPGFAGIRNSLFEADNAFMVFGDAKKVLQDLVAELRSS